MRATTPTPRPHLPGKHPTLRGGGSHEPACSSENGRWGRAKDRGVGLSGTVMTQGVQETGREQGAGVCGEGAGGN